MWFSRESLPEKVNNGCFLALHKLLLVPFCFVLWCCVLFSVFSFFCITSFGDCSHLQHLGTTLNDHWQYVCDDGYFTGFPQPQGNENLPPSQSLDIEDIAGKQRSSADRPVATKRKRGQMSLEKSLSKGNSSQQSDGQLSELSKSWKEVLGEPPKWGPNKV